MFASETAFAFGKIQNDEFLPSRIVRGPHAYDGYHLYQYFQEIINSRSILKKLREENLSFSWNIIPRPDRAFSLFQDICISSITDKQINKTELGGSLMEIIDGYDVLVEALDKSNYEIKKRHGIFSWNSIEASKIFREACQSIHPQHSISVFNDLDHFELNSSGSSLNSLYDRAVSSYAFQEVNAFSEFLRKFDFANLQILGFLEREDFVIDPVGTTMTYFNLGKLHQNLANSGGKLYYCYGGRRPTRPLDLDSLTDCVEAFFVYAKNDIPIDKVVDSVTDSKFCRPFVSSLDIRSDISHSLSRLGIESLF